MQREQQAFVPHAASFLAATSKSRTEPPDARAATTILAARPSCGMTCGGRVTACVAILWYDLSIV